MDTWAEEGTELEAPVPELCPGREVGWIFKNGDAVAVERLPGVSPLRDE